MPATCIECGHPEDMHARHRNGAYRCRSFGCGCEIAAVPSRRLTRQERLEGLADRGTDTWEEYREER